MPDVEVSTYLHQAWPSLVEDINRQPPGTHVVVIGYSLGANNSVLVANRVKYVDLIIALQPSMLTSTPPLNGKVGRMIEIYNPNPWMTFGGMGSQKLVGENIEYIENNDSHPGAQFDPQFHDLVKTEVASFADEDHLQTTQAKSSKPIYLANLQLERPKHQHKELAAKDTLQNGQARMSRLSKPAKLEYVAQEQPQEHQEDLSAFAERPNTLHSEEVFGKRQLTIRDMEDFVERTYQDPPPTKSLTAASN